MALPFEHDRTYGPEELDRLLAEAGAFLSFIGCVVIRRDLWCEREKDEYIGTEFIHVGVIFQAPLRGRALAIAQPWIVIRYGNAQWGPRKLPHLDVSVAVADLVVFPHSRSGRR